MSLATASIRTPDISNINRLITKMMFFVKKGTEFENQIKRDTLGNQQFMIVMGLVIVIDETYINPSYPTFI